MRSVQFRMTPSLADYRSVAIKKLLMLKGATLVIVMGSVVLFVLAFAPSAVNGDEAQTLFIALGLIVFILLVMPFLFVTGVATVAWKKSLKSGRPALYTLNSQGFTIDRKSEKLSLNWDRFIAAESSGRHVFLKLKNRRSVVLFKDAVSPSGAWSEIIEVLREAPLSTQGNEPCSDSTKPQHKSVGSTGNSPKAPMKTGKE